MSTRFFTSTAARVLVGGACLFATAGCGGDMLRTGRSPVYLIVDNLTAQAGGTGSPAGFLLSDVEVIVEQTIDGETVRVPTTFNDSATVTLRAVPKNTTVGAAATQPVNGVTLTRYHIDFRRTDGRNTPGVDVPYGFDGGVSATINPGTPTLVAFEIVRHQSKLEPPLRQLRRAGGLTLISTIAEITFYGHDQNGNEVMVTGRIDVQFGDFADET